MSIGLSCVSMPAMFKVLGHHLPPYEKLKSWLTSRYSSDKPTTSTSSFWKPPRLGGNLLFNKSETPNRSRDSYLDIERNNPERLDPNALSSPYEKGSMQKSVRTFINSGRNNVIEDDGIHFEIEMQQHSRQYDSH